MKSKLSILIMTGALLSGVWANAVTLDLRPPNSTVGQSSLVQVELWISGLGTATAPSLGAYDFTLAYNPALLGYSAFHFGDPILGNQLDLLGFGTVSGLDGATPGQLSAFEISLDLAGDLDALQASAFTLGTVSFKALRSGTSAMQFTSVLLSDAAGNAMAAELGRGSVSIPEPVSGGWMAAVMAALVGAGARKWKRNRH